MTRGHRPPTTKGPAPRSEKPSPLQRLADIERSLHSLTTGDLHGLATNEDIDMLHHVGLRLKSLRLRLETRIERRPEHRPPRRPDPPPARRQKP